jgi:hypothetical protein
MATTVAPRASIQFTCRADHLTPPVPAEGARAPRDLPRFVVSTSAVTL